MIPTESPASVPGVVLDTNATLDWLVFGNPGMALLSAAIQGGMVRWLACPRMREELSRTLSYASLARWNPDSERTLTCFDRWANIQPDPIRTVIGPLICTDPDDQIFMDLALEGSTRWLVTHDRALLKLRRPAAIRGLQILQPALWAA